jgi:hypothetical protein
MKTDSLFQRIEAAAEIYVYGAGKMGQQLTAVLRNLPLPKEPRCFLANTGVGVHVDGLEVRAPSATSLAGDCLVLVASGRGNHPDIAATLKLLTDLSRVLFITPQDLDLLKKTALAAMLRRIGIDPSLLRAMTNDFLGQLAMFDSETYNGSIRRKMFELALEDSARFVIDHMADARSFSDCWSYRQWVLERAPAEGRFLEFGVADGSTLDFFARLRPDAEFFGFDSFVGLPEFWKDGFDQGRFAQTRLPEVPRNVELIQGWFCDTLPVFMARPGPNAEEIAFIHIDCDLYSSTRDVLMSCAPGLKPGTILAFDEYFNYPGWQAHEHKAFTEFAQSQGLGFRYIAFVENGNQVAVEVTSVERSKG